MELTKEQSRAINEDEHLVVTANAGSGKTKTLVDRYLRILDNKDIRVKNIVAITFTRKAASEMLARIAEELNKKIQDKTDSSKKKYQDLRRDLINNRITTIHSFCSRILRDFPIEADIPVNFSEISEFESQGLIESAILETIEEILDKDYENYDEAIDFLQRYDYKKVKQYLEILLNKSESYSLLENIYNEDNYEQIILSKGLESMRIVLLEIYKTLNENFAQPYKYQTESVKGKHHEVLQNISNLIEEGYNQLQDKNNFSDFYSFFVLINPLCDEFKIRSIRQNYASAIINKKEYESEYNALKDLILELTDENLYKIREVTNLDKNNSLSREMIANAKFLSDLVKITHKKIKKEKNENAWVDFNDMITLSSFVLKEFPKVSERISRDIRHLMVDEFQDTNRLQYDIVKNLVRELLPGEDNSNIKLYIVGDAKQSIYRFRSADVSVFNQAIEDIQATVNNGRTDSNDVVDSNIKLSVCFRLTPAVTAGVNFIFSNMFEKDAKNKEYYIAYEPLVYGRNIIEFDKQFAEIEPQNDSKVLDSLELGSFNVLLTQTPNNRSEEKKDEELFSSEAEVTAKKILSIVNEEKTQYQVKLLSGKKRFPEFRDITIISRTRGEFKKLSDIFDEYKIPYTLSGSSGFYNSQEIIDLISFLKFLNNPLDNTALASILKSPFFNLSDTDLMNIAYFNLKSSFDSNLHYIADDSNNCAENTFFLQRASKILKELKINVHKLSISSLIRKIIDITVWESAVTASKSPSRMKANVRKLIEIAEGFESRGYKNLYDFIEELIALEKQSSEGEADFIADDNTVKIMTIHAAKGLEFPIVFLYNTSRGGNHSSGFYIDNNFGITLPNLRNDDNSAIVVSSTSALHYLAMKRDNIADDAENKRILYVAMTRAEDHLFISSTYTKTKTGVSVYGLAKMIFNSMELDLVNITEQHPQYVLNVPVEMKGMNDQIYNYELPINFLITPCPNDEESEEIDELEEYEKLEELEEIKTEISVAEIESEQVITAQSNDSLPEDELILLNCNLDTAESNYFSATRFITYKNNEQAYIDRYILSMPDFEDKPLLISNSLHQEQPETITGSFAGSIIHKVFEQIGVWCNSAGFIDEVKLSDLISYEVNALGKIVHERFITEILKECKSTAETKLIQNNINSIIAGKKELTLVMPIAKDFYYTQFDLLININENMGESQYEVWDWKSNKVKDKSQIPSLAEHYLPQMEFYGLMLAKYNPKQDIFRCKLLFTKLANKSLTESDWTYTFEFKKEDLQKIEEKYYELSRKIKNT